MLFGSSLCTLLHSPHHVSSCTMILLFQDFCCNRCFWKPSHPDCAVIQRGDDPPPCFWPAKRLPHCLPQWIGQGHSVTLADLMRPTEHVLQPIQPGRSPDGRTYICDICGAEALYVCPHPGCDYALCRNCGSVWLRLLSASCVFHSVIFTIFSGTPHSLAV